MDFSQENAHHGVFPKRFVANKMSFRLGALSITVRDEDWNDMTVLTLELQSVESVFSQRPSADYLCLEMDMERLTVTGLAHRFKKKDSLSGTKRPACLGTMVLGLWSAAAALVAPVGRVTY